MRPIHQSLLRFLVLLLAIAPIAAAQVTVVKTFPGINGPNPAPNDRLSTDMMVGVGPKYLVSFINAGFSVWAKDGQPIQAAKTLHQFWSDALENAGGKLEAEPYDPRIFFDPLTSRWFATSNMHGDSNGGHMGMTSSMLIGVSSDDDPAHRWKAIDYHVATPVIDNNKLGVDKNGFYMTSIVGVDAKKIPVVAIPKQDLLWTGDSGPSVEHVNYFEVDKAPADNSMGTHGSRGDEGMIPAFDLNPNKKLSDPMIYINRFQQDWEGETVIQIRKVTWVSPTKATIAGPFTVGLGRNFTSPTTQGVQPALQQPGLESPTIRAGGGRLVNAAVSHGSVWAIAATEVEDHTGAFWLEIRLSDLKLVQLGMVGDPKADVMFASLNVDAKGNLGIAMNRGSATDYLSAYVTGRLASDPPNTLRPLVKAAEGKYVFVPRDWNFSIPGGSKIAGGGTNYMDFSTVVVDPANPTLFWSYQEVPTNDCMPNDKNGGRFGTAFVAFRIGGAKRSAP